MDFLVLNIRLIEGDEGLHPVAIRYEENGVQYERLTSAEEVIRLLKKAAWASEEVIDLLRFAVDNSGNFTEHDPDGVKHFWIAQAIKALKDIPRLEKEHEENLKNWDVRAESNLLDELPNIKAGE